MTTVPLSEAKAHLSEFVGRVHGQHERVVVSVHGKPSAVLIAVDDLAAMEETLQILAEPGTLQRLGASQRELERGEGESLADLRTAMAARAVAEG